MLTVDRFEEDKAVIIDDDEKQLIISREKFSPDVNEGDVVVLSDDDIFITDKIETDRRKSGNIGLLNKLLNK